MKRLIKTVIAGTILSVTSITFAAVSTQKIVNIGFDLNKGSLTSSLLQGKTGTVSISLCYKGMCYLPNKPISANNSQSVTNTKSTFNFRANGMISSFGTGVNIPGWWFAGVKTNINPIPVTLQLSVKTIAGEQSCIKYSGIVGGGSHEAPNEMESLKQSVTEGICQAAVSVMQ